jgi:leucyl/phenylalanyl-tRNA--protein transferase
MKERLSSGLIRCAYEQGVFPMGDEDGMIGWYEPQLRAMFPISGIRVSRSLSKTIRNKPFEIRFDTCFEAVMRGCLRPAGNWITEELICVYTEIHHEGWGHSAECWEGEELVGGVYGIAMGGCFCAESMFHRRTDASKIALYSLVEKCRELGFQMFDAQIQNPHLASLGSFEIPQSEYLDRLDAALMIKTDWSR